jgi:methionine aminotransferase
MSSSLTIRTKLPHTGTSIFAVMTAMANRYDAINLAQGFPDFPPPGQLVEAVNKAMQEGHHQYAPLAGIPALRNAIAQKCLDDYKVKVDADEEVTVTAGATYGLFTAFQALLHEGDEVLVFEPAYDSYVPGIQLAGAEPVFVELHAPDFRIDWEQVKKHINARTRAILINSPHNPSGTCWTDEDARELEKLLDGSDILVISDEVYEHITFDGIRHHSILQYDGFRSRGIAVFSFGKTYHNTGWKMGYVVAPPEITHAFRTVHQFLLFSVNHPMQHALAEFLQESPQHHRELPAFYQAKRDLFLSLIEPSRFTFSPAKGTYFQLLDYTNISDKSDTEMAEFLTREHGVASIPLSPFYKSGSQDKVLRFCFAKSDDTLQKAAALLCKI